MRREIKFKRGHDCIRFRCIHESESCKPGGGGSHGRSGMQIRFLLHGDKGAVQFLLMTGWMPFYCKPNFIHARDLPRDYNRASILPADLGYHSRTPLYDGHDSIGKCPTLDGAECYYDGSSLNAMDAFYCLVNGGEPALWKFLEGYYASVFEGGEYPAVTEYPMGAR